MFQAGTNANREKAKPPLEIPIVRPTVAVLRRLAGERGPRGTSSRSRVLVVDDHRINGIGSLFGHEGFTVEVAPAGRPAKVDAVDAVIVGDDDYGLALMRTLRARDAEVIVIVLRSASPRVGVDFRAEADFVLTAPARGEDVAMLLQRAFECRALARAVKALSGRAFETSCAPSLVGSSPAMQRVREVVAQVANARASVLIVGELGTGKERVARAVHMEGARSERPFVKLHCSALSRELIEAELFGDTTGAVGAARREGALAQAVGGTLFIDEVGDLPVTTQERLLRALEERRSESAGATTASVDVRVVASSHHGLDGEVRAGRFLEEFFARLSVVHIAIPPLRERPSDILPLAEYFLQCIETETGQRASGFEDTARARLVAYPWPGNANELRAVVERAAHQCGGGRICEQHLAPMLGPVGVFAMAIPGATLDELERQAIVSTVEAVGSTAKAARMLGVSVRKIQYKLQEYGIASRRSSMSPLKRVGGPRR